MKYIIVVEDDAILHVQKINNIDKKHLKLLAENYLVNLENGGGPGCYDDISITNAYQAGYEQRDKEIINQL